MKFDQRSSRGGKWKKYKYFATVIEEISVGVSAS